eukprot:GILK01004823.1.p1 GENE.GILK01004823.1~~GILK01004823.1.p1  ORF type:complete len:478 (+),score=26.16 GILK01004823.1:38-1471(+)
MVNGRRHMKSSYGIVLLWLCLLLTTSPCACDPEHYDESLLEIPLGSNFWLHDFRFTTISRPLMDHEEHYEIFPKALAQIMNRFSVEEYHVSLTQGRWQALAWGNAPIETYPYGGEVWAYLSKSHGTVSNSSRSDWRALNRAMGSLICASLEKLDEKRSVKIPTPFSSVFDPRSDRMGSLDTLYGILPSEAVCTENLTPWSKLIPHRNKDGVGKYINSLRFAESPYHALVTHVERLANRSLALTQVLSFVSRKKIRPDSPLLPSSAHNAGAVLQFQRYWIGAAQSQYGGLGMRVHNLLHCAVRVTYLDALPYFLRLYFHTMKININGKPIHILKELEDLTFQPSDGQSTQTFLGFSFVLPALSSFALSVDIEKSFLHIDAFPPDPSRGFDVGPASILYQTVETGSGCAASEPRRMVSDALLVMLPQPDFSMPFNVITLSSTIVAFFFGSLFNLFTRRHLHWSQLPNKPPRKFPFFKRQ